MSESKKRETFVYEGLGFPIRLINVPMRKVFGEWAIDVNFNSLQKAVLYILATQKTALTGPEIKFIIDYFEMSYRDFAKTFGVSHTAVLKWVKEESKMNPGTESCLRLHILNKLGASDIEFRLQYSNISPEVLSYAEYDRDPLEIDARKIA